MMMMFTLLVAKMLHQLGNDFSDLDCIHDHSDDLVKKAKTLAAAVFHSQRRHVTTFSRSFFYFCSNQKTKNSYDRLTELCNYCY